MADRIQQALFREERVALGEAIDAKRDRERLGLLSEIGREVLSARSLDDLSERAVSLVFDAVRAERGALLLRDEASGGFEPRMVRRRDSRPLEPDELRVPRSIIREVVDGRVGLLTSDAFHDPRFEARASVQASNIRSAICAPLWFEDEILGVIYLDSRLRSYAFTRADLVLLNAIANLIGIRVKQESLHAQLAQERVVRANLERYHSPDVVEAILSRAGGRAGPETGVEERDVTVMFADLVGFTKFAESVPPAVVAELLNGFYNAATRIVFDHGGTVNEYVGDSVLTIFGAPIPHADHAERAANAGLELLRELPPALRAVAPGSDPALRIAINSGPVVVGSIGSPDRLKYAVIGDPVNVAARLERIGLPGTVILGEPTYRKLGSGFACEDLGPQTLRGREKPVRAYALRP